MYTLKSFVDGLTFMNAQLAAKNKKKAKAEIRSMFVNADKVIFSDDRVCVSGRNEVLRFFVEHRSKSGKLKPF